MKTPTIKWDLKVNLEHCVTSCVYCSLYEWSPVWCICYIWM